MGAARRLSRLFARDQGSSG